MSGCQAASSAQCHHIVVSLTQSARASRRSSPPSSRLTDSCRTDDQGWGDNEFNCDNSTCATNPGQCCAHTPNIKAFAQDPHTALLHRFYAAASVCSPTRAAYLTGRTNNRDCIDSALPCCSEDVADTCSQVRTIATASIRRCHAARRTSLTRARRERMARCRGRSSR